MMKAEKGSEIITTICEYENSVAMPDNERLTSRLIDFKYLREAEAPAYTHGVSNDTFDYEFDDDDDDIPAFSFPEA
ncbi:hypothetical protein [Coprococcus comes]|uniref:hypothetical protein n=1 Tax=Coprococcus comes TaxID=410072 RepID=UPI003D78B681